MLVGALALGCAYASRAYLTHAVWQIVLGATLCSAATAIAYAAMPSLIMRAAPITETASANGLNTLMRSIGTSTSSAAVGAILTNLATTVNGHALPELNGFRTVFLVAAVAAFASAGVTLFIPSGALHHTPNVPDASTPTASSPTAAGPDVVVSGQVLTPSGLPVRRAVITALDEHGAHLDWGRVEDGSYQLALPGDGRYVLVASGDGWATVSQFVTLTGDVLPTIAFDTRLQLTGRVRRHGEPAAHIALTLMKHSGEYHADGQTDADGCFSLPLPPPGRYVLTALDATAELTTARSLSVMTQPVDVELELWRVSVRVRLEA